MHDLPGLEIANRPLRFYWVLDTSSSMSGSKIGTLNHAIREALPAMRDAAAENAHASVEVKVLTFASGTRWMTPAPVPVETFTWTDVSADGLTDMGAAMREMAKELSIDNMPERGLPPVVVLVSDGQPTDNFDGGLKQLLEQPWAKRAVRIAIGIGGDVVPDVLRKFIGHVEIEPLQADNSKDLVNYIRWVSTQIVKAVSAPKDQTPTEENDTPTKKHGLPPAPPPVDPADVADDVVW